MFSGEAVGLLHGAELLPAGGAIFDILLPPDSDYRRKVRREQAVLGS